jgi:hypothetical protein
MSQFVDECRREWRRLRVPDSIANEMAADLEADLADAEADGASAEQVLGSSAFDPRSFAASWAAERGVIRQLPVRRDRFRGPSRSLAALIVIAVLATIGLGLALTVRRSGSSMAQVALVSPFARQPAPSGATLPFGIQANGPPGAYVAAIGLLVLLVGILGLILLALYWSPWANSIRAPQRRRSTIDEHPRGPGYF